MPKPFRIRCSAISKLMGKLETITEKQLEDLIKLEERKQRFEKGLLNDKGKKTTFTENMESTRLGLIAKRDAPDELPTGAKTYLKEYFVGKRYKNTKRFSSKYTDKGILVEPEAIELVKQFLNIPFGEKNTERKSNSFITGECDLYLNKIVFDVKAAYDCHSFPVFDTPLKPAYYGQGQGYMNLWEVEKYMVAYCLLDMPEEMIWEQVNKKKWERGEDRTDDDIYEELKEKHTYSHLPIHERIRLYPFDYNHKYIEKLKSRIEMGREYIKEIIAKKVIIEQEMQKYIFVSAA